jgi:hypothetical protein
MSNKVEEINVLCDRCKELIKGQKTATFTSGFYLVGPGHGWNRYSFPGEEYLCDKCMWTDPRYVTDYGTVNSGG